MGAAEKCKIHQALEDFHGQRGLAAAHLGITGRQLSKSIRESQELTAAWGTQTPVVPGEMDVIRREGVKMPDPEEDIRLAEHFISEDRKLNRGLTELKLTTEERDLARAIGKFHQKHFFRSMDIIGGGVTVIAIKLLSEVSRIQERLVQVRALISSDNVVGVHQAAKGETPDADGNAITFQSDLRKELVSEERMLYQTLDSIANTINHICETSYNGQMLLAGVKLRLAGMNPNKYKGGKPKKPGFTAAIEENNETTPEEADSRFHDVDAALG